MTEHEAFERVTSGLAMAVDGLKMVSNHRPDERDLWLQMAQTIGITRESIYRLAGEGTVKGKS